MGEFEWSKPVLLKLWAEARYRAA